MDRDPERILHIERITGENVARVLAGKAIASETILTFEGRSAQDGWVVSSHTFVAEGRRSGILTTILERRGNYGDDHTMRWGF